MNLIIFIAGICIVLVTMFDMFMTTMGEGGGFLTRKVTTFLFRLTFPIKKVTGSDKAALIAGISVILFAVFIWIMLLWLGWFLIFFSDPSSVVDSYTLERTNIWGYIYYTGFSIFTLGVGDLKANGDLWRVLTPVATLLGWGTVTFAITYLIPVVQAFNKKRGLAVSINKLGSTPQRILINNWENGTIDLLYNKLNTLSGTIAEVDLMHKTYPVLHFLHEVKKDESLSVAIVKLDETLTIIDYGLSGELRSKEVRYIRSIIKSYLETMQGFFIKNLKEENELPSLSELKKHNIPVKDNEGYLKEAEKIKKHRIILNNLITHERWRWDDIYAPMEDEEL
jgi:hypothetical protein